MAKQQKKYFLGKINERNGEMEYDTRFLFSTGGNADRYMDKIACNWRAGTKKDFSEVEGGYWCDGTLIFSDGCKEVPKEDFDVMAKYLTVL